MTAPARRRSRQPLATMPEAKPGKFFAALVRGKVYHLTTPNQKFVHGVPQEVTAETYDYLAAKAIDTLTYTDHELGKVRRTIRKFQFAPPLDELADEVVLEA